MEYNGTKVVLSLYDYTAVAVRPWAEAGYTCICLDIQHTNTAEPTKNNGMILYAKCDLHSPDAVDRVLSIVDSFNVVFGMAFPVCTDLAVSGASRFQSKAAIDPLFQEKAVGYAVDCSHIFENIGCGYFIENPVSVLSTKWRKPDYIFSPHQYGGYIPYEDSEHPLYPEYIPARDAYKKRTCLWTGNDYKMPEPKPVPLAESYGNGYSRQMMKLGGKSVRTKNIRSATPRGFSIANFEANNNLIRLETQK